METDAAVLEPEPEVDAPECYDRYGLVLGSEVCLLSALAVQLAGRPDSQHPSSECIYRQPCSPALRAFAAEPRWLTRRCSYGGGAGAGRTARDRVPARAR
jgi:hypothetical protein